jgi:hypothetical protein
VGWCARKETAFIDSVQWPVRETMMKVQAACCIVVLIMLCSSAGHMLQPQFHHYASQSAALYAFVISGVIANAIDTS